MKKYFIFFSILLLICNTAYAGKIIVKNPQPGLTYVKGSSLIINWGGQECREPTIKINIFRNSISPSNFVLQLTGPNNGSMHWMIPGNFTAGKYILRVITNEKGCFGDSGVFSIIDKKQPNIGIIQAEKLSTPHRHRAPALVAPSHASFQIKNIHYDVNQLGKLKQVRVVVKYSSTTPFSFNQYKGDPRDGPVYMNCKIMVPVWPMDKEYSWIPSGKGPVQPKVVFNQRLSIKYGGKNRLEFAPLVLNAGNGTFELIFTPAHSGKLLGLHTMTKMKGGAFSSPNFCETYYTPKIALRLFIHTKEGVKQVFKEFYLYNLPRNTLKIPGELSICSGGMTYW